MSKLLIISGVKKEYTDREKARTRDFIKHDKYYFFYIFFHKSRVNLEYIFYDYKEQNRLLEFLFTEDEETRLENLVVDLKNIFPTYNLYLVDYTKPSLGMLISLLYFIIDELSDLISVTTAKLKIQQANIAEMDQIKPKPQKRKRSNLSKKKSPSIEEQEDENYEVDRILDCRKRKVYIYIILII